jgi:dCMP deaminase
MQHGIEWWNHWFLNLAKYISTASKDPSTKTGAVIVRPDKTVASMGYNGFPRGITDTEWLLANRDEKYKRIVHCEMNAILTAKEDLKGYTLYTWPLLSCDRCAVHVIQSGIKSVVAPSIPKGLEDRWGKSVDLTIQLFNEAGVVVNLIMVEKVKKPKRLVW